MSVQLRSTPKTKFAELEQFLADCGIVGGLGFERFAKGDRYRVRDALWKFPEKSSALEREDRAPELIEPNRNDLRISVTRNQFVTALQAQEHPRAFQLSLGKKTDDLALRNSFCRGANRRMRVPNIDRNATQRAQNRVQNRVVIVLLVDDVPNRARASELQNDGVNPGDVVRQSKKTAGGNVSQPQRGTS